ncbi:hypothetical protein R5R35_001897 [Gryllus longicercus]|uniref:Carbonic anhydrase n=2 Tax=Gryllus longicercus TaxID=2509291 RepID=A0AAN9Z8T1_9ORTH
MENIQHVLSLSDVDGSYPSPIDLNIRHKVDIELPDLEWNHYEKTAHKMKVTNSGHTVVLSAKWKENKPFIISGPLPDKYIFSQMHFHWGSNDNEGSEHTIEGFCFPMEMHVVHFKASYSTRKIAHQRKDGLVVTVYLFQIQEIDNRNLSSLIDALPSVCVPYSSTSIMPSSLEDYAPPFSNNYFLYWGSVNTVTCSHEILWFVCREPVGISRKQLYYFRKLKGPDHQPMANTFKGVQSLQNRSLFLVNGESPLDNTLKPLHLPPSSQIVRKVSHITGAQLQSAECFSVVDDDLVDIIPHAYSHNEKFLDKKK